MYYVDFSSYLLWWYAWKVSLVEVWEKSYVLDDFLISPVSLSDGLPDAAGITLHAMQSLFSENCRKKELKSSQACDL